MSSADTSFRSPMAVAVIGGLVTSTLLSLLVIPVAYTYLDDIKQLVYRLWRRLNKTKTKTKTKGKMALSGKFYELP